MDISIITDHYWIVSIICLILLLIFGTGIYILHRRKKRRLLKENTIPDDLIKDFERAEELMLVNKGVRTPQEIQWQVYKEKINPNRLKPIDEKLYMSDEQFKIYMNGKIGNTNDFFQPKENKLKNLFKKV